MCSIPGSSGHVRRVDMRAQNPDGCKTHTRSWPNTPVVCSAEVAAAGKLAASLQAGCGPAQGVRIARLAQQGSVELRAGCTSWCFSWDQPKRNVQEPCFGAAGSETKAQAGIWDLLL